MHMADDYGIWWQLQPGPARLHQTLLRGNHQGQDFRKRIQSYSWDKYEKGDPSFLFELLPRIARKEGELATVLGLGTGYLLEKWGLSEAEWKKDKDLVYWKMSHPKHHSQRGLRPVRRSS